MSEEEQAPIHRGPWTDANDCKLITGTRGVAQSLVFDAPQLPDWNSVKRARALYTRHTATAHVHEQGSQSRLDFVLKAHEREPTILHLQKNQQWAGYFILFSCVASDAFSRSIKSGEVVHHQTLKAFLSTDGDESVRSTALTIAATS